mmetsp:Transcript_98347/g.249629  ORF Transcript_98347/g.249629 Transcript_98347/m.249629 type:complete len:263 (-) Transcript_98347:70-858(-)
MPWSFCAWSWGGSQGRSTLSRSRWAACTDWRCWQASPRVFIPTSPTAAPPFGPRRCWSHRRPAGAEASRASCHWVFFQSVASAGWPGLTAKAKIYKGMEQAFSKEWLRSDSGVRHPKTEAALTNGQLLTRRGARQHHAKIAEGVDPDNGLASRLAQGLAIATHNVAPSRLRNLAQRLEGTCPVLVVCAGRDRLVRYAAQRHVAETLGLAVVEVLDLVDSSHGVTDERRDEVNAALARLLEAAEHPARGRVSSEEPVGLRSRL